MNIVELIDKDIQDTEAYIVGAQRRLDSLRYIMDLVKKDPALRKSLDTFLEHAASNQTGGSR